MLMFPLFFRAGFAPGQFPGYYPYPLGAGFNGQPQATTASNYYSNYVSPTIASYGMNFYGTSPSIAGADANKFSDKTSLVSSSNSISSYDLSSQGINSQSNISSTSPTFGASLGVPSIHDKYLSQSTLDKYNGLDKAAMSPNNYTLEKSDNKEVEMKSESPAPSIPSHLSPYNSSLYYSSPGFGGSAFHPSLLQPNPMMPPYGQHPNNLRPQ